jgi:hypothetical protein
LVFQVQSTTDESRSTQKDMKLSAVMRRMGDEKLTSDTTPDAPSSSQITTWRFAVAANPSAHPRALEKPPTARSIAPDTPPTT